MITVRVTPCSAGYFAILAWNFVQNSQETLFSVVPTTVYITYSPCLATDIDDNRIDCKSGLSDFGGISCSALKSPFY